MGLSKIDKLTMDGYNFSGVYDSFKEPVKKRAAELKKEGYLVRVVFVPASKFSRGCGSGGYSVYTKSTKKLELALKAKKEKAEKTKQDNLKTIKDYLTTRTGVELVDLLKKVLEDDFLKNGEFELLSWAKKEKII